MRICIVLDVCMNAKVLFKFAKSVAGGKTIMSCILVITLK